MVRGQMDRDRAWDPACQRAALARVGGPVGPVRCGTERGQRAGQCLRGRAADRGEVRERVPGPRCQLLRLPPVVVPSDLDTEPGGQHLKEDPGLEMVDGAEPAKERGQRLPGDRGERKRQRRRRACAFGRVDRGVPAEPGDMAVRAGVRPDCVTFQCPVERPPAAAEAENGHLGQQGGGPQMRVIGQAPPAVGRESLELVGSLRWLPRDLAPVHVVADCAGTVPEGLRDHPDRRACGMLGQQQLGPLARQHVRHGLRGCLLATGVCAVMSTAIVSRLFRVIFSVPSMIAWFAASRTSQSRLPITPRVRRCR